MDSGWEEKFSIPLEHTFTAQPILKLVDHINWNIQYMHKYIRLINKPLIFIPEKHSQLNIPVHSGHTSVSSCYFWVSKLRLCSICVWRSPLRRLKTEPPARCSRPSTQTAGAQNAPSQGDESSCSVSLGLWHLWLIHCPRTVNKHTNNTPNHLNYKT